MSPSADCTQNRDDLKLVREGTSQEQRFASALDSNKPDFPLIDEHTIAHRMVFARAYAAYLKFYNLNNAEAGDWQPFFGKDVSALLATAAIQDVDYYRSNVKEHFDFLKSINDKSYETKSKDYLGYLFSCIGSLAKQLDALKDGLPADNRLKATVQNLIRAQLSPAFKNLILYYRDGKNQYLNDVPPAFKIMGGVPETFSAVMRRTFSEDWIPLEDGANEWADYLGHLYDLSKYPATGIYGSGGHLFERINHIATHNLFTSIFDQFLKAYARIVKEADADLEDTFRWDNHEPHYALFLAFLHLFEYARGEANTLTGRHLDFYYREILRLKEKDAEPGKVHLLVELAKQVESHKFKAGELFKAGKDALGKDVFFACNRDFVANQAKVTALKTGYRHKNSEDDTLPNQDNRLFASPTADSDDGQGAELTSPDHSWHPFYNKVYRDGELSKIRMPEAEIGFAIASHYLLLAGGERTVTVDISTAFAGLKSEDLNDIAFLFTAEKGWLEAAVTNISLTGKGALAIKLSGGDPSVVPYSAKVHGYSFAISPSLPILLVKLRHSNNRYIYYKLEDIVVDQIKLTVDVTGLKTLAVTNDFGPVDTSKPFQPFGASPVANSSLIIGSKEVFQKTVSIIPIRVRWQDRPDPYNKIFNIITEYLQDGEWQECKMRVIKNYEWVFQLLIRESSDDSPYIDLPDLSDQEQYSISSTHGFVRLRLENDFGQGDYQKNLLGYLRKDKDDKGVEIKHPGNPPIGPFITELTLNYTATQTIDLNKSEEADFEGRLACFYHIAPFGEAEQHPYLNAANKVFLLPQFGFERDNARQESEAEFYIGITGLKPPQNLALLFQVADGTADPLSKKPDPHIHWSYLSNNEWIPFGKNDIEDKTDELLNSGVITFSMSRQASDNNTLLPAGMHWIRAAVESNSDAVCRLRKVAAQALEATFTDNDNDPAFPAKVLASETISKLDQPDAAVKKIIQPYESFGGRGKDAPVAFYTRVSERLRHKDRAIALWDYERLILDEFPQIHKVKCLNHTRYEPNENGKGIYRELAPGHVTIVAIPDQQFYNLLDPLRPYTSLGLLKEIETFLTKKFSCFVTPHVKNPEFEDVQVKCNVSLTKGSDESYYREEIQKAITRFLSPWAFPGGSSPTFGGKIYKSVLINFLEDLTYVDYVTDFQLWHTFIDLNGDPASEETDEVEGSKAVSILVSVSSEKHEINSIKPAEADVPGETCTCKS